MAAGGVCDLINAREIGSTQFSHRVPFSDVYRGNSIRAKGTRGGRGGHERQATAQRQGNLAVSTAGPGLLIIRMRKGLKMGMAGKVCGFPPQIGERWRVSTFVSGEAGGATGRFTGILIWQCLRMTELEAFEGKLGGFSVGYARSLEVGERVMCPHCGPRSINQKGARRRNRRFIDDDDAGGAGEGTERSECPCSCTALSPESHNGLRRNDSKCCLRADALPEHHQRGLRGGETAGLYAPDARMMTVPLRGHTSDSDRRDRRDRREGAVAAASEEASTSSPNRIAPSPPPPLVEDERFKLTGGRSSIGQSVWWRILATGETGTSEAWTQPLLASLGCRASFPRFITRPQSVFSHLGRAWLLVATSNLPPRAPSRLLLLPLWEVKRVRRRARGEDEGDSKYSPPEI